MTIMLWLAIGGGAVAAVCGVILAIFALRFAGLARRALVQPQYLRLATGTYTLRV